MRELALFAGAGGGLYASLLLGWKTVCAVERDPYRRSVLEQRQRDGIFEPFEIHEDVREFDGRPWRGRVDVVSGGFPCRPFSTASRGRVREVSLWPEFLRIVDECRPRYVFAENVQREPIVAAAEDLADRGYAARYVAMGPAILGAASERKRYWLVADADHEGKPAVTLHAEMAGLPTAKASSPWADSPSGILGMDARVARRSFRLAAVGDGQVPVVAACAWRFLARVGEE